MNREEKMIAIMEKKLGFKYDKNLTWEMQGYSIRNKNTASSNIKAAVRMRLKDDLIYKLQLELDIGESSINDLANFGVNIIKDSEIKILKQDGYLK